MEDFDYFDDSDGISAIRGAVFQRFKAREHRKKGDNRAGESETAFARRI